ncbi:pyridoxamine 5'-phosphate oxidase family protein [Sphingobacterium sp. SG20118]|uniref:pyridoxamine 5'-phosphate oxidase family protein n=1 Tax=Sphingobacterium TaxID=28453 RepID=UPI0004F60C06|nr:MULTISPECIES: pyridoxamine 5'-phosphate oxidase family protein [Sphingobacterium]AIM37210.1 hypothetical protein KO02_11290 [Sphingobacterium sp. ML3W]MDH5826705.1 pyridoxamine 5'-phosphate oxidase family protein [Sphingobacterium faecium]
MSTENLHNLEAIHKLRDFVNKIDIGMMCTYPVANSFVHAVPMSRQEVDEEGNIWYLISAESETFKNLESNNLISLLFSQVDDYNFLSINGEVEISNSQERIEKYWNRFVEAWFEKGKDDPHIRILKVKVQDAHYWDNKTNKLVTIFQVAKSAISGQKIDIGREGELNI